MAVATPGPGGDSPSSLMAADAAAALIILDDGQYLLQHRDDRPAIWYPGHWGCFGGAVDDGEDAVQALRRELREELELELGTPTYFTSIDFDLSRFGLRRYFRSYYVVRVSRAEQERLVLHEGQALGAFPGDTVLHDLRVTPYDAFVLFLHHARARIGRGWGEGSPA
jgi:8-oxo-dGTP pyrophosphatase MutT (NUDIX family)